MWGLTCPILFLVFVGRTAMGELWKFDLSSLRPDELCGRPSGARYQPDPTGTYFTTIEFCPIQNHINLFGADETTFMQRVEQIRNVSANRAVSLYLMWRSELVNATILAPIGRQIVQFTIEYSYDGNLTSEFPAIGLSNLLDLRFWACLSGLRIHKGDFSGLRNIRAIEFQGSRLEFVEEGTFTDLPTLRTLALGNRIGNEDMLYNQLKCDAKNSWLWEFLKGKPSLLKKRPIGDIFRLGNFTSTRMEVEQPDVKCNGTEKSVQSLRTVNVSA